MNKYWSSVIFIICLIYVTLEMRLRWDSYLFCLVHLLASWINLLGVSRRGCWVCKNKNKNKNKKNNLVSVWQEHFSILIIIHCSLSRSETVSLFVPEWAYELIESPHACDAAPLSVSDCSWSPMTKHKLSKISRNICECGLPFSYFLLTGIKLSSGQGRIRVFLLWWTQNSSWTPTVTQIPNKYKSESEIF